MYTNEIHYKFKNLNNENLYFDEELSALEDFAFESLEQNVEYSEENEILVNENVELTDRLSVLEF